MISLGKINTDIPPSSSAVASSSHSASNNKHSAASLFTPATADSSYTLAVSRANDWPLLPSRPASPGLRISIDVRRLSRRVIIEDDEYLEPPLRDYWEAEDLVARSFQASSDGGWEAGTRRYLGYEEEA